MNKSDIKIVFMGTPEFASVCLDTLLEANFNVVAVVSQPDKPVGRKHVITPPPTKVRALEAGIPVFQPDSMKTDESYEEIKKYNPDLIILGNLLTRAGDTLLTSVQNVVHDRIIDEIADQVQIRMETPGEDSILYGCAMHTIDYLIDKAVKTNLHSER